MKKTGRLQGGTGTEQSIHFNVIFIFSETGEGSRRPRRAFLSRNLQAQRQCRQNGGFRRVILLGCVSRVQPGASAELQGFK